MLIILLKRVGMDQQEALGGAPVHEGALGIHEIELVVQPREDLCDGGGVGDHAHRTLHLRQVTACHTTYSKYWHIGMAAIAC